MNENNEVIKKLITLQDGFVKDLRDIKNPDHDSELILKAKIVAIGQALDVFGYKNEEDKQ